MFMAMPVLSLLAQVKKGTGDRVLAPERMKIYLSTATRMPTWCAYYRELRCIATGLRINSPSDLSLVGIPKNFLRQKKLFLSHINDSVISAGAKCLVWRGLRQKTSCFCHD
jgi:hypothetical protein